jgi:hypothetical protein
MIEATTNPAARNAFELAHNARAEATREFWQWVFGKTSR